MASGASAAYRDFRETMRQAGALIRMERTLGDPPDPSEQPLVEGLRGGAVVLMVAAFEAFLRDLLEERVNTLESEGRYAFNALPKKMQVAAVFNLLNTAMKGVPSRPAKPQKFDRLPEVVSAAQHVAHSTLVGSAFGVTGGSATSDTVKRMFEQVDRRRVLEQARPRFVRLWGSPVPRTFLRDKLDWIVEARNQVAHGASVLSWSRDDLKEAERFLRLLAKTLDDDLRIYLNKISRSSANP